MWWRKHVRCNVRILLLKRQMTAAAASTVTVAARRRGRRYRPCWVCDWCAAGHITDTHAALLTDIWCTERQNDSQTNWLCIYNKVEFNCFRHSTNLCHAIRPHHSTKLPYAVDYLHTLGNCAKTGSFTSNSETVHKGWHYSCHWCLVPLTLRTSLLHGLSLFVCLLGV